VFSIHITHDVDHVGMKDHYRDLAFPKFFVLNLIGLVKRTLSAREFLLILSEMAKSAFLKDHDAWTCIEEWIALEAAHGVRSTWFAACRPRLGLSYTPARSVPVVRRLVEAGYNVGLHSQCREDPAGMPDELAEFRRVYGISEPVPLRMHFLAKSAADVLPHKELFTFDSSVYDETAFSAPDDFQKPINIMDTFFFCPLDRVLSLREAQQRTEDLVAAARSQDRTLVVDFHQRSLSRTLPRYREYILWFYEQVGDWRSHPEQST